MNAFGNLTVYISKAFKSPTGNLPGAITVRLGAKARAQLATDGPPDFASAASQGIAAAGLFVWQGVTFESDRALPEWIASISICGVPFQDVSCKRKRSAEEKRLARK